MKRYQIFVSSTYQDLADERLEVIKALLELDCFPCSMEYFPAASEESWSYIAELIEQCDYYLVIVGGRYGSLTPEGISFTQKEYEYALSKGIPSIAFLHANPEELASKDSENSEEGREKLERFVQQLRTHLCKSWTTSHELGAVVSRSLTQLIRRHPRTGWIPASEAADHDATQELLRLTQKVQQLESELAKTKSKAINIPDLADGDEKLEIIFNYSLKEPDPERHYGSITVSEATDSIIASWADVFKVISPRVATTASDVAVKNLFKDFIAARYDAPRHGLQPKQFYSDFVIATEAFNGIRIQFVALGYVTVEKEKREDGSAGSLVWRLTELGEQQMFKLFAVRKRKSA